MSERCKTDSWIAATLGLAVIFWWIMFRWKPMNFWLEMPVAAGTLALCSLIRNRDNLRELFHWQALYLPVGLLSAFVLYAVFRIGDLISAWIFPFAGHQVGAIYQDLGSGSPVVVGFLLSAVIGPAEEIFWRGFLQRTLARRLGRWPGWFWASLTYGALHAISGNFMLAMAALLAGAFWGLIYLRYGSLWPGILSHSLWDLLILLILPIH